MLLLLNLVNSDIIFRKTIGLKYLDELHSFKLIDAVRTGHCGHNVYKYHWYGSYCVWLNYIPMKFFNEIINGDAIKNSDSELGKIICIYRAVGPHIM